MNSGLARALDGPPSFQAAGSPADPPNMAVALAYRPGLDGAPLVLAKGKKELALAMIREAKRYEIPVIRDPELARVLDGLKTGVEIPDNLYRAVVEVFAFLISGSIR